jgi:hypothetical protein
MDSNQTWANLTVKDIRKTIRIYPGEMKLISAYLPEIKKRWIDGQK